MKREREEDASDGTPSAVYRTTTEGLNPLNGRPYSTRYFSILQQRERLPVFAKKQLIRDTMHRNPVTLLVGETGSGKTTQVPPFLCDLIAGPSPGMVACTQPRRIAAVSVAMRVAEEMDVLPGAEVGYHVRFQPRFCDATRVLYMTDGMLLREAYSDGELSKFSVVVVDEAHERSVDTDLVLGILKRLLDRRPDFRLVVMSATLDVGKIARFFPNAPLLHVSGHMYDVDVFYMPRPVVDYVETAVECIRQTHEKEAAGDILCFLTGEAEIERAVRAMREVIESSESCGAGEGKEGQPASVSAVEVLPLYGSLSLAEQQRVFDAPPSNTRKIVFSTNIAETSVTIDGIVYVVDCGYQKQNLYNSEVRVNYLLPCVISKASAQQRKGRAGRTRPGKCFRLYTSEDFAAFPEQTHPEILRTNIVNTILLLLHLGVENPCDFPFLDTPSDAAMNDAFYQLLYFGAVDEELQLTAFGRQMASIPVDACLARMLLKAPLHGCAADAAAVAAMLEAGNAFTRPPTKGREADEAHAKYLHPDGDHIGLFFIFHDYLKHQSNGPQFCYKNFLRHQALVQASQIYTQLRRMMADMRLQVTSTYDDKARCVDTVALRKAVLEGFFMQVAFLPREPGGKTGSTYKTVRDAMPVRLHAQSTLSKPHVLLPQWILFDGLEVQGKEGTFIRIASPVEVSWLREVSDFFVSPSEISDSDIAFALRNGK